MNDHEPETGSRNEKRNKAREFDQAVEKLSTEATEALAAIQDAVAAAETASDESTDVAEPIVEALSDLSHGDRVGATQAAMVLFSDDTRPEVAEARTAALAALASAETAGEEVDDVVAVLAEQADAVSDALDGSALSDRLGAVL
jgi:hypothetical protein